MTLTEREDLLLSFSKEFHMSELSDSVHPSNKMGTSIPSKDAGAAAVLELARRLGMLVGKHMAEIDRANRNLPHPTGQSALRDTGKQSRQPAGKV